MNRPYIFCHMMTSIDGKISGSFMDTKEGERAEEEFYHIAFGKDPYYHHQGWLSGRITTDDNFTFYKKPILDECSKLVEAGDYIADPDASMYYVSIDLSGKLGWDSNTLTYQDTKAHVIEVLSEKASNAYKAMLRNLKISYIIAGKDRLDYEMLLDKLKRLFHIETLMLGGGGVLNWSFIQAGMCDEVSIVIASSGDGSSDTPSIFESRNNLIGDHPISFSLTHAQVINEDCIWLRYRIK